MTGRLGHGSCDQVACHHCLLALSPRIATNVDTPEWRPGVGSLSHARALLTAGIQMLFWQLSHPTEKEDEVFCLSRGITIKSGCAFKSATKLKGTDVGRPAQFPPWVWSGIWLSTDLRAITSVPTQEEILHCPAVASKQAWTADSRAFGWSMLHGKLREQLTEMKHPAWMQVPWLESAPITTNVQRNLHKSYIPSTH